MKIKHISIYIAIFFILNYLIILQPAFASYSSTIVNDHPVGYWRLGETSGTSATDLINAHNGSYAGSYTQGVSGALNDPNKAFNVGAASGTVTVAYNSSLNMGDGPFTFECWARRVGSFGTDYEGLFSEFHQGAFYFGTANKAVFWDNYSGIAVTESGTTVDSNWHHWVVTKASGQAPLMYKDGIDVSTNRSVGSFTNSSDNLVIGSQVDYSYPFNGDIDEFAVYNTVLTPSQITNHYNAGLNSAGPLSNTYQLASYGFGSGGTLNSTSGTYSLQGISGEIDSASMSSSTYMNLAGLTYTTEPNTPPAPVITNPSNAYYNKLLISINNANNPSDTTFAIQIASNSADFSQNVYYVQSGSNTLGANPDWQTYTAWNSGSNITLVGLYPGTTYYARVAAKRGTFQIGRYSAIASAATVNPSLTFSVRTTSQSSPPFSVFIGQLNAGAVTTSPDEVTTTITTNANSGGLIYLYGTNTGLKSTTAGNYTISSTTNDLDNGGILEGYGARGTSVSGAPMELLSPYNQSGNNVGILDTTKREFADSSGLPVTSGQASFQLKAKAKLSTPPAGDYSDTITVVATGSF